MIKLADLDHVILAVEDLDTAADSWQVQFSLIEREREANRSYLAVNYEPYSVILEKANTPGLTYAAYNLHPDFSLEDAEKHLKSCGVDFTREDEAVVFKDPENNGIKLVPFRPREGQAVFPVASRYSNQVMGGAMRRLGHVNYLVENVNTMVDFYTNVVGQEVADRLGTDAGAFMKVAADHHINAFVHTGTAHPHHLAFDIGDWGMMREKLDHLSQHERWFPWGPVRHGIGGNLASYVRLPEAECFIELYCDMEQLDEFHVPREFPDDRHSSSVWGMLPPRSYFRFDEETIRQERESLRGIYE